MNLHREEEQFENVYYKIHENNVSEFKIHFYVKRVAMGNMNQDDFLYFIRKKGIYLLESAIVK